MTEVVCLGDKALQKAANSIDYCLDGTLTALKNIKDINEKMREALLRVSLCMNNDLKARVANALRRIIALYDAGKITTEDRDRLFQTALEILNQIE